MIKIDQFGSVIEYPVELTVQYRLNSSIFEDAESILPL